MNKDMKDIVDEFDFNDAEIEYYFMEDDIFDDEYEYDEDVYLEDDELWDDIEHEL